MSIETVKANWEDTEDNHKMINESFIDMVNVNPYLKELRDWVEQNAFGFGERSFYWMWKLIVDEMPQEFTFMEIGVFRGQILALIQLLAKTKDKKANIIGISPMTSEGGYWESDYTEDVNKIHNQFNLNSGFRIIQSLSTDLFATTAVGDEEVDILYIDGGHESEVVRKDLQNYLHTIKVGGYLVIDDSAVKFNLPFGYFRGHESVSTVVDEFLPPFTNNENFEHLFNVVHNRVWRKKK